MFVLLRALGKNVILVTFLVHPVKIFLKFFLNVNAGLFSLLDKKNRLFGNF